ncbi:hypothetical protein [Flaviflexus equikiangi]|uniref:VWFA domain-containing protein n=1 Tax=Flaviflexus equikiangi TaxID=2758573 RepID=A0ABS2TE01_9ACTO|nr:hypothetical protein [Flaviflexus equikiangi]MBM9432889.1 hypothetical protein [Flaviflexus equikiangi]
MYTDGPLREPQPSSKPADLSNRWRLTRATFSATFAGLLVASMTLGSGAILASASDEQPVDSDMFVFQQEPVVEEPTQDPTEDPTAEEEPVSPPAETEPTVEPIVEPVDDGEPAPVDEPVEAPPAEDPEFDILAPPGDPSELANDEGMEASRDIVALAVGVPLGDPGERQTKLIVRAGGSRTGAGNATQTVSPLPGVTYQFYRTTTDTIAGGTLAGECTTDANGECGIIVDIAPSTTGSQSRSFYAVPTGVPAGWTAPTSFTEVADNYRFSSGLISTTASAAARTVTIPRQFNSTVTTPRWANVRANNPLPDQCGIDIALVMDLSNSVTDDAALLAQYKQSANGFVTALTGTPSRIGLYTFATNAPANGANNVGLPLTSVSSPESAAPITARINAWGDTPENIQGGTNWDRGFHQVAESGVSYDIVMFLTDGAPTFHRNQQGTGNSTSIAEVNEAIHSANAVKAMPGQPAIIAVGIGGAAFTQAATNRLSSISGPNEGVDFVRSNFEDLEQNLRDFATENCGGTVTVTKQTIDENNEIIDPTAAGWEFTASTAGSYLETPGTGTLVNQLIVETTEPDGNFNVGVNFDAQPTAIRPVTFVETQQDGYEIVPQVFNGQSANASCFVNGQQVPVTNAGELGFTVNVSAQGIVSCLVQNRILPVDASVTVDKEWIIEGESVANGDQPAGWNAQLTLTGPEGAAATNQGWGVTRTGYTEGDTVTINETTSGIPQACTVSAAVTAVNGETLIEPASLAYLATLAAGDNTYTITNTVDCVQTLVLTKTVSNGPAVPADWTVSGTPLEGAPISGAGTVTGEVDADTPYVLAEADNAAGPSAGAYSAIYVPTDDGWVCTEEASGETVTPVDGAVSVPLGGTVDCEIANETSQLTLLKFVDDPQGISAQGPDSWQLTAAASDSPVVPGLASPAPVTGSEDPAAANTVWVRPAHTYTVSEETTGTNELAFIQRGIQRYIGDTPENPDHTNSAHWVDVTTADIQVDAGASEIYRFVNEPIPPIDIPITGGTGAGVYLSFGGGLLGAALLVAWRHRNRMDKAA